VSAAAPLGFHARARNYMAASGREWDPHRMWLEQCTPRQRRRLMHKERRSWVTYSRRSRDMPWDPRYDAPDGSVYVSGGCDVCGLPDPYRGTGDGIGSCDCPRCECGEARSSAFCTCPPDDYHDPEEP
jgi:hypothetical protein